jgi:hypothetical protein
MIAKVLLSRLKTSIIQFVIKFAGESHCDCLCLKASLIRVAFAKKCDFTQSRC